MPSAKFRISTAAASAGAAVMLIRSVVKYYLPRELQDYFYFKLKTLLLSFSNEMTFVIEEYESLNLNHLFKAVELYLEPLVPLDARRLKLSLPNKENNVSVTLETNQEILDTFNGVALKWRFVSSEGKAKYVTNPDGYNKQPITEHRFFELSFHKKHKDMVLDAYVKHVVEKSKEKEKKKMLKLFTLCRGDRMPGRRGEYPWQSVNLDHPANFDTLAMDAEAKRMIMEDLERFVRRKEFYRRVGKAWKRGYLLFGPPGTGKSSLIAAMANYLSFDIYDLELTELKGNSELRTLLISTANKSILVVEDIDCTIELQDRIAATRATNPRTSQRYNEGNQVTLSGLLNFIDGLWSSCGDERIIVFTTNHKEKLDPALLRPGRMDVHIHMSYCTPCGFRMLASNYLGVAELPIFKDVEALLETTKVSPAEVGEQLMRSEEPEVALRCLVEFLQMKKQESEESEEKERNESNTTNESAAAAATATAEANALQKSEMKDGEDGKKGKPKKKMTKDHAAQSMQL